MGSPCMVHAVPPKPSQIELGILLFFHRNLVSFFVHFRTLVTRRRPAISGPRWTSLSVQSLLLARWFPPRLLAALLSKLMVPRPWWDGVGKMLSGNAGGALENTNEYIIYIYIYIFIVVFLFYICPTLLWSKMLLGIVVCKCWSERLSDNLVTCLFTNMVL